MLISGVIINIYLVSWVQISGNYTVRLDAQILPGHHELYKVIDEHALKCELPQLLISFILICKSIFPPSLMNFGSQPEPIAVVGSACRFPGKSHSLAALWDLLKEPHDVSCEIPDERFEL